MDTHIPNKQQLLELYNKYEKYVDDILLGKKSIAKVTHISEDELADYYTKAKNALKLEDYERAEELFTTLVILNNKDNRAAMGLAGALEGQGKYEAAAPLYFMVMATTPFDPVAPFRGGICMMQTGKKEEAIELFNLAAGCGDDVKDPRKMIYVEKAKGMLRALTETN